MEKVSLSPQVQPGESSYSPPTDMVPLPSKGIVYPVDSPLAAVETVEIRAMTARDEDILTSRALLRNGKVSSVLLKSCLTNKSIDTEEMLMGDRNAILIAIRITGYGAEYRSEVDCPNCNEKVKHEFNLAQLPIRPLTVQPAEPNKNIFNFKLKASNMEVLFRLSTGADERELSTIMERMKKAGASEAPVTTRLMQQVVSLGGETNKDKISQMIRNLPARDSRELRMYMDKITPGVDMVQKFLCSECEVETEVDVPLGTEFFWPSG